MKTSLLTLLLCGSCSIATAQHLNSTFATLAINETTGDAVGVGPVEVDVFTRSDFTFRLRGVPLQGFALLAGDYEPAAAPVDAFLQFDLALPTIDVVADGLTAPSLDFMTDATGNYSYTTAFPGRDDQSDFTLNLQALIANPFVPFGVSATAAARLYVRAGYDEHDLGNDDCVEVPFRQNMTFEFYGKQYDRVWVTSNGRICFGLPTDLSASAADLFNQGPPAVAGMYHDFDPTAAAATKISTSQYQVAEEWRFKISYEDVQEAWNPGVFFDFDVTLMPYGVVQITISDRMELPLGFTVVGLTPGGYPAGGAGFNVSGVAPRPTDLSASLGQFVFAGDGLPAYEAYHSLPYTIFPYPAFDMNDTTVTFYPAFPPGSGNGGYNVN